MGKERTLLEVELESEDETRVAAAKKARRTVKRKQRAEMRDAVRAARAATRAKLSAKKAAKKGVAAKPRKTKAKKGLKKSGSLGSAPKRADSGLKRSGTLGSASKPALKRTGSQSAAGPALARTGSTGSAGLARTESASRRVLEVGKDAGRRGTGHKWQFVENDKTWRDYKPDASAVVEQHYHEWEEHKLRPDAAVVSRGVKSGDWHYTVDFDAMEQQNADHAAHTKRRIRRVPDSTAAGTPASARG